MATYARPIAGLIEELSRLPGIGPKSAQRLAFHLLRAPKEDALRLAAAVTAMTDQIRTCAECFNYSEDNLCPICADERRDRSILCVVAEPRDLMALERSWEKKVRYHVLQGLLSPMDGIGPQQLRVRELLERVRQGGVEEIVLATNPTVEGDATAIYLSGLLKPLSVKTTRIALGLPVGGDLDYADQVTISRAMEGRREM